MIGANWYGHPARELTMIGVTGTSGKTTSTYLIKSILEQKAGAKVGLIGTIQNMIGSEVIHTERTTPESFELQGLLRRIAREKRWTDGSVGRFLYDFFEQLIARDLHRLEKLEDRIEALEDRVLADELDGFSAPMTALRKETSAWFRYYSQLDDVACELRENENGFFSDGEQLLFRMFEDRVIRLREESQLLRESCTQV